MTDPDHDLVDRLLDLHPPRDSDVALRMDEIRASFKAVAHQVVREVPRSPDRTIAIRSIHRACMDSIAALACNQDGDPVPGESNAKVGGTLAAHMSKEKE